MLLQLSPDQELLRRTTAKFLEESAPVTVLRKLRHDASGFPRDYWRRGAELGWTSPLVSEDQGGGSVSGHGLLDLTLVAYELGRAAAPGPLAFTNAVALALSAARAHEPLLGALLEGSTVGAFCLSERAPSDGLDQIGLEIAVAGDDLALNGVKRPVEAAPMASHLLVTGRTNDGLTQVVVPAATQGVSIAPMQGIDLTRRFFAVTFTGVRVPRSALVGALGGADASVERQRQHAAVLLCAEAVGAMQKAFEITVAWAFERYSFGRPLASYQALKHRFAHMATWLQASHAITDEAAWAVSTGASDADQLVSAAKAYVGAQSTELLQECVQLHGGIGVTFEHDLHLYLRRVTLLRTLLGTPDVHRRRLARLVAQKEAAP